MQRIRTADDLEAAVTVDRVVLYKHSRGCGLSAIARAQIEKFTENFPDASVFFIDVLADRSVSNEVAARFGIPHESPQVILVEEGSAVAHASHLGIRSRKLGNWWSGRTPPG